MSRISPRIRSQLPPLILRTKYWFEVDGHFAIGEGGIGLLRAIAIRGSLARAAEDVGWSYRHAWGYLRRAEVTLGVTLTVRRPGKGAKRGVDLSSFARALLCRVGPAHGPSGGIDSYHMTTGAPEGAPAAEGRSRR